MSEESYDPRACGARCDECPLGPLGAFRQGPWAPVPPELHEGATVIAVAEMPGAEDAGYGRPLSGRSGGEWNLALLAAGHNRAAVDLTHAVACSAGTDKNAWEKLTKALDKENRRRLAKAQPPMPDPTSCCRPRLLAETDRYENILALGRAAANALTAKTQSIFALRGGPVWVDENYNALMQTPLAGEALPEGAVRKVFPVFHPGFVQKSPGWRSTLHADLAKAFRWFSGQLRWTKPEQHLNPSPAELREFLRRDVPFWAYDLETDGIEALTCQVRSIAIAHSDLNADGRALRQGQEEAHRAGVVGLNILSGDGSTRFYSAEDEAEIHAILREFFLDPTKTKVGHNAGYYDRQVVEQWLGVTPAPIIDTLFAARFRAPELPKGLKVVGSVLTDVDRWETTEKGESLAHGKVDDWDRLAYNCTDSTVNARIVVPLLDAAEEAGAFRDLPEALRPVGWENRRWDLHEVDHATQDMCVNLHKIGVYVDQEARFKMEIETRASVAKREKNLTTLAQAVGVARLDLKSAGANDDGDDVDGIRPGSADQIRDLLYENWKLGIPPNMEARDFYTQSGMPGTGDKVLRGHLAGGRLTKEQEAFLRELRLYRREKNKILGTVLLPLNLTAHDPKKGIIWHMDGRVRSTWNAHVTAPGRLSSSGPNLQNIGSRKGQGKLKTLFAAQPGNLLVGADLDQAHLRITANYWRIPLLLECFSEGKDPHNTLAYQVFGDKFKNADGWGPEGFSLYRKPPGGMAKAMRDVMKTFRYASIYWADPMTVWQVLTSTEADNGEMPYLHMTSKEVRHFHETWLTNEPEWMTAWETMLALHRQQGFMEEPVLGRRSGGLSDGKKNEVVNFPILAAETSAMRIAEQALIHQFPWDHGRKHGLIHQCHDSVAVEIPAPPGLEKWKPVKGEALPPELERYRKTVEECMTVRVPGWEVAMTAEASVGRNLKEA
jgi:DNA polymerase I-like protein with 3'-5' exonuclease and polymerase domains/uracil-DNA glycosylase